MNIAMRVVSACCLAYPLPLAAQEVEPVVSKEALSVHTVERGDMPVFERASGSLVSLQPPRAALVFADPHTAHCEPGRTAKVQIDPSPKPILGKVVQGPRDDSKRGSCEVELTESLPVGTKIGQRLGALIEVEELTNVVFFARPADSSADSVASVFVLEPGSSFARRKSVRYGKISGPLIQILEGLAPGDRVIVTDVSKWAKYERVRVQ
jgi:HlyD family secretion protein